MDRLDEAVAALAAETGRETDGRWLAAIADLPGVIVYGRTEAEAVSDVRALAREVLADRREHGEY